MSPPVSREILRFLNNIDTAGLMEEVMTKLRNVAASTIQYSELLRICRETYESCDKDVAEMAKLLDHSGNVVVLGNSVLLYLEQFLHGTLDLQTFS